MYSGVLKETYISKWVIILLTLGLSTHVGAVTVRDGTNISRAIPSEQNLRAQSNVTNSRATTTRSQNITPRTTTVSSRVATTRDNSGVVSRAATATGAGKKARNFAEKSVTARATATNNVARAAAAPKTNTRTQSQRVATRARTATTNNLQEQLTNMAQLQQTCLTQYTECMDNYCNVLDENMGRCACSKNITNYKKTSDALKESNTALQDVAQQIQYIGLNKVQIETLFAETEAEMAMSAGGDNTKLKNSLDKIKDMVIDIKTPSASSTQKSSTLDLSGLLDFSSDGTFGDIMSLFGGNDGDVASISNQRGATLYNTAAARCRKTVLDTCKVQGVDSALITNTYDMTIDKDCLAYESYLTEQNDEMLATIRNATNVLQRARLSVAANKNSYDLRGCIGALETCMTDEYMCGGDYEYCLDYEGKYIVAGEVVLGSEIGEFKTDETKKLLTDKMLDDPRDGKAFGPCAEPMNLCQDYTYVDGVFTETNRVIDEYLTRVIPQIKKRHDEVIAEFRSECISDVIECVNENNRYSTNDNISDSAVKSCASVITTCMSALGETVDQKSWVAKIMDKRLIACENSGGEWDEEKAECTCTESDLAQSTDKIICINKQQLCTDSHGTWDGTTCSCTESGYTQSEDKLTCVKENLTPGTNDTPSTGTGGCKSGYYLDNGNCTLCPAGYACSGAVNNGMTKCTSNQYSAEGASSCKPCYGDVITENGLNVGCTQYDTVTCYEGTYYEPATKDCQDCPAGYYCDKTTTATKGQSTVNGRTLCESGTYQPNTRQTSCIPCPENSICDKSGLTDFACDENNGYFKNNSGGCDATDYSKAYCETSEYTIYSSSGDVYGYIQNQFKNAEAYCACGVNQYAKNDYHEYTDEDSNRCQETYQPEYANYPFIRVWECGDGDDKYHVDVPDRNVCYDVLEYHNNTDNKDNANVADKIYAQTFTNTIALTGIEVPMTGNSYNNTATTKDIMRQCYTFNQSSRSTSSFYDPKIGQCGCKTSVINQYGEPVSLDMMTFGNDTTCICPTDMVPIAAYGSIQNTLSACFDLSYVMEIMNNINDTTYAEQECENQLYGQYDANEQKCTVTQDGETYFYYVLNADKDFVSRCKHNGGELRNSKDDPLLDKATGTNDLCYFNTASDRNTPGSVTYVNTNDVCTLTSLTCSGSLITADNENRYRYISEQNFENIVMLRVFMTNIDQFWGTKANELGSTLQVYLDAALNAQNTQKDTGHVQWYKCSDLGRDETTKQCRCPDGYKLFNTHTELVSLTCIPEN